MKQVDIFIFREHLVKVVCSPRSLFFIWLSSANQALFNTWVDGEFQLDRPHYGPLGGLRSADSATQTLPSLRNQSYGYQVLKTMLIKHQGLEKFPLGRRKE